MTKRERVAGILLDHISPAVIFILGIYTIVWGFWIFAPWWTVFTQAPLYSTMAGIGTEYFWGGSAMIAGAITLHGALHPWTPNIQRGSLVGFFHWLLIAILYFIGDWTSTGGISSFTFACFSALVWVNTKVNKRQIPKPPR